MKGRLAAVLGGAVAVVSLWAGTAWAHVTVEPSSLAQGTGDAVLTFRVPNESTTATVSGLKIQFPVDHPIVLVSPEAGSGWVSTVQTTTLAKPVTTNDGTFSSVVSEIDWSGGSIPVGQFGEFQVLAQGIPTGTSQLVFKTIEEYSDGTSVAWIEVPDAAVPDPAHPAPTITLTAPGGSTPTTTAGGPSSGAVGAPTGTVSAGHDHAIAVLSLIVAGLALVLAVLAVWLGRPWTVGVEPAPADPGS